MSGVMALRKRPTRLRQKHGIKLGRELLLAAIEALKSPAVNAEIETMTSLRNYFDIGGDGRRKAGGARHSWRRQLEHGGSSKPSQTTPARRRRYDHPR